MTFKGDFLPSEMYRATSGGIQAKSRLRVGNQERRAVSFPARSGVRQDVHQTPAWIADEEAPHAPGLLRWSVLDVDASLKPQRDPVQIGRKIAHVLTRGETKVFQRLLEGECAGTAESNTNDL
jgi:hypothetical protein